MRFVPVMAVMLISALMGCAGKAPDDFAGVTPRFVVEQYFSGTTRAWGIFEDRFGKVRRQFSVDIEGRWDGRELILDERFVYKDGETDRRVWTIRKTADGRYEGRADDVIGTATGIAAGNALNWRYAMMLKVGDDKWRVQFDDWMFQQDDEVMINRAAVSKWGIEIGQVTLVFRKASASR
jgi:hypothetical protein